MNLSVGYAIKVPHWFNDKIIIDKEKATISNGMMFLGEIKNKIVRVYIYCIISCYTSVYSCQYRKKE